MGHSYTPIFRITPWAGPVSTTALAGVQWLRLCQPAYIPVNVEKEMVDYAVQHRRKGYRCTVTMEFYFTTSSTSETALATILSYFADDRTQVELSLDNGTTYRVVHLSDYQQRVPDEKNIGIIETLLFTCQDLLETKPAIGSGSW